MHRFLNSLVYFIYYKIYRKLEKEHLFDSGGKKNTKIGVLVTFIHFNEGKIAISKSKLPNYSCIYFLLSSACPFQFFLSNYLLSIRHLVI